MNTWTVVVEGDVRKAAQEDGLNTYRVGANTGIVIRDTKLSNAQQVARKYGSVLYSYLGDNP